MKYYLKIISVMVLLSLSLNIFLAIASENEVNDKKNLLIIHSYHQNFIWTEQLHKGISDSLTDASVNLFIEYLDTYRFGDKVYNQQITQIIENYTSEAIEVIIVTDNDAYALITSIHETHFKDIPIVFAGLNNVDRDMITGPATGILENTTVLDFYSLIKMIHPGITTLAIVGGETTTANHILDEMTHINNNSSNPLTIQPILSNDINTVFNGIESLDKNKTVLYTAGTLDSLDHSEFATLLESETHIPTYVTVLPAVVDNVIGGYVIDPYEHGTIAGNKAHQLLNGVPISDIEIIIEPVQEIVFNFYGLKKYNIEESALPQNSIIINKFDSTITVDRAILSVLVSTLLLATAIIILLIYTNRTKSKYTIELMNTKKELMAKNDELQAYTEELMASQEELDRQYHLLQDNKKQIQKLADFDPFTGLLNVNRFTHIVNRRIDTHEHVYVIYISISNLESISYSLGYMLFESVLKNVAEEIQLALSSSKRVYAVVNGDEFLICGPDIGPNLQNDIAKLCDLFDAPFYTDYFAVKLQANMGVSRLNPLSHTGDALVRQAAIAAIECKFNRKVPFLEFSPSMQQQMFDMQKLQAELDTAIAENQFILHYQPKYAIDGKTVLGFEALIRWQMPDGSIRYPNTFIQGAELSGRIHDISRLVIIMACETIAKNNFESKNLHISINLSSQDFENDHIIEFLTQTAESHNIKKSSLELEVTETSLVYDIDKTRAMLTQLQQSGFSIALDDFGTGYSSLSYLRSLPVDKIKIDKTFIDKLDDDDYVKILKAIVMLSNDLNYRLTIEGVETIKQFELLKQFKPEELQGYLFSKPLPLEEALKLINKRDYH